MPYGDRKKLLDLCIINKPRKQKLKVEILHDLKEFCKEFFNFVLHNNLGINLFYFQKIAPSRKFWHKHQTPKHARFLFIKYSANCITTAFRF